MLPLAQIPALLQALNTAFVLNPGRLENDTRTSIAILGEQKPKRVLINIGVNDGLWMLLLLANPTNFTTTSDPIPNMKTLALHLKELCPDTERFYINLMPKPSSIANLMPPWLNDGNAPIPHAMVITINISVSCLPAVASAARRCGPSMTGSTPL